MQFCQPSLLARHNNPEDEDSRFDKSLRELKELRSQLHYAADYCQSTYLNAPEKKDVVENTKEYVCRAVVTLVDHLGNVSASLDCCISKTREISDADIRLDCMLQRLLLCEKYAHKLALNHLRWSVKMPRHHLRYMSTLTATAEEKANAGSTVSKPTTLAEEKMVSRPEHDKDDIASFTPDGLSILSKGPTPTFHFQLCLQKSGRKRSLQGSDTNWLQGTQMSEHRRSLQGTETNLLQGTQMSRRRQSLQGSETTCFPSIQKSGRSRSLQGADFITLFRKGKS